MDTGPVLTHGLFAGARAWIEHVVKVVFTVTGPTIGHEPSGLCLCPDLLDSTFVDSES